LPKETGIETSPEAVICRNIANLQRFPTIFDWFQWIALQPYDHSKFREIDRLPK
jgi:hypothetical protein